MEPPVIPGEVPEPDDSPEDSEEENTGQVEDQTSERDEVEIPEPEPDELPEDNDEENIVPAEDETPHHSKKEIQEPDTDELLEQYGKEYGEDETLESYHKPQPPSPIKREAKKPVTVPAPPGRVSSETVDDALFLSPVKAGGTGKITGKQDTDYRRMHCADSHYCGRLFHRTADVHGGRRFYRPQQSAGSGDHTHRPTIVRTIPSAMTTTPASRALVPLPTQLIPSGQKLYFQVQKNPVTSKISVIFAGSAGEGSIKSADIKVTHPDGSVATGIILPLKGVTEITLEGSKETDRVEIIAQMSSGGTYRVYDELVPLMR